MGTAAFAFGPGALWAMEKHSPSLVGRGGFARAMRLAGAIGMMGGFLVFYNRSLSTFTAQMEERTETLRRRVMAYVRNTNNSAILRLQRERSRGADGHARDG